MSRGQSDNYRGPLGTKPTRKRRRTRVLGISSARQPMALLTRNFCPKYAFTHTVTYANKRTIAASAYGIKVPAGFKGALPAPDIINTLALQSKTKHGAKKGAALTILSGLVVSSVKLRFPDPDKQWKNDNAGSKDSRWQFQGGNICFELNLEVYVLDTYRPIPNDKISKQLFGVVLEHEMLHVQDEIDIVENWLPIQAYQDSKVIRFLTNASPLIDRQYKHWITDGHLEKWLIDGLWVPEHNKRGAAQDSPQGYAPFQKKIDDLRIRQVNEP